MKQNLYLFSDIILRKKDNTLLVEKDLNANPAHEADIDYKDEECVILNGEKLNGTGEKKYVPMQNVEAIYCFGTVKFNSIFLSMCSYHFIPVHVFSFYGKYLGSFLPKAEINSGNILIKQALFYENRISRSKAARSLIEGAVHNIKSNLNYYKYRGADIDNEIEQIDKIITDFNNSYSELEKNNKVVETLLGVEGNIRKIYYSSWNKFLRQETGFEKRNRRPPQDMINCLISFGNTMMYTTCINEIYRTGLNPSIGILHTAGENRFPLSFDIAEIFKPVIIDKVIFKVINLGMISPDDFSRKEGILIMKDKAKRKFVEEIESRLKTVVMHPKLKRGVSYRTLIRMDCYSFIKYLNGTDSADNYETFKAN